MGPGGGYGVQLASFRVEGDESSLHMLDRRVQAVFFFFKVTGGAHPPPAGHTQTAGQSPTAGGRRQSLTDEGRLTHPILCYTGHVDLGAMWIDEATSANPLYQLVNETLGLPLSEVVNYNAGQVFDAQGSPVNMAFYAVSFSAKTVQHEGPWPQA